ncbi:MAG TPA: DUF4349 domain-containing protein [Lachnospiraceae bacterium]|nr:DUF4349 domain-containing protein [Lachnospiraceae bacterium]
MREKRREMLHGRSFGWNIFGANAEKGGVRGILSRKGMAAVLLALTAVLCTGCGAAKNGAGSAEMADVKTTAGSYNVGGSFYEQETGLDVSDNSADYESGTDNTGLLEGRKLIKTVELEVETKEFDQTMSSLETQIQDLGGYVESMDTYNGSSYSGYSVNRSAHLTVRIPGERLSDFLKTMADIGNIVRRYDNVEDVTLSYVDMESRRNTLRTEQSRLLEFLDKAETIEDIITIEQRLSEVRYQLESMESQLRTIDNLVDYSTVELSISEVKELTPVEEPTVWERISEGFGESLLSIGHGTLEFGIWFLVHIPYLVIWGVIIAAIVLVIRKHRRKKRKKLDEQLKTPGGGAE